MYCNLFEGSKTFDFLKNKIENCEYIIKIEEIGYKKDFSFDSDISFENLKSLLNLFESDYIYEFLFNEYRNELTQEEIIKDDDVLENLLYFEIKIDKEIEKLKNTLKNDYWIINNKNGLFM